MGFLQQVLTVDDCKCSGENIFKLSDEQLSLQHCHGITALLWGQTMPISCQGKTRGSLAISGTRPTSILLDALANYRISVQCNRMLDLACRRQSSGYIMVRKTAPKDKVGWLRSKKFMVWLIWQCLNTAQQVAYHYTSASPICWNSGCVISEADFLCWMCSSEKTSDIPERCKEFDSTYCHLLNSSLNSLTMQTRVSSMKKPSFTNPGAFFLESYRNLLLKFLKPAAFSCGDILRGE